MLLSNLLPLWPALDTKCNEVAITTSMHTPVKKKICLIASCPAVSRIQKIRRKFCLHLYRSNPPNQSSCSSVDGWEKLEQLFLNQSSCCSVDVVQIDFFGMLRESLLSRMKLPNNLSLCCLLDVVAVRLLQAAVGVRVWLCGPDDVDEAGERQWTRLWAMEQRL